MLTNLINKELKVPIIKINDCGNEIIFGTDQHHNLLIEDEKLKYFNSQSCTTISKNENINFIPDGYNDFVNREYVQMVSLEKALLIESTLFDEEYKKELEEIINKYNLIKQKAQERANKKMDELIEELIKKAEHKKSNSYI